MNEGSSAALATFDDTLDPMGVTFDWYKVGSIATKTRGVYLIAWVADFCWKTWTISEMKIEIGLWEASFTLLAYDIFDEQSGYLLDQTRS